MAEKRLYNAMAASAMCAAGKFNVCGLNLRPFSLLHAMQLDAIGSPLWTGASGEAEPSDIYFAAQICASDEIVFDFKKPELVFDEVAELEKWIEYVRLCASKPMQCEQANATGSELEAPVELVIIAYLIQHTTLIADEVWRMPYGLAVWYFESVREQRNGETYILSEKTAAWLDELNSEKSKKERAEKTEKAKWIIENVKDESARLDLLSKLENGELPENFKEVA